MLDSSPKLPGIVMPDPRPTPQEAATIPPLRLGEEATLPPPVRPFGDLPRSFGRYRLEKLLGQGGMGVVYLATDTQLNRLVALKIPELSGPATASARTRFLREAQAAAALQHPNICPIFDVGEHEGTPYLTMAYLCGQPLSCRLDPAKPFEPSAAIDLVRKLALALHEAHARGVVHRDLKPGNIIIDDRGEPFVLDFGLARRADWVGGQLTQQGDVLGTPAYMPPEQILGHVTEIGPATDIYSLGIILYELLTGSPPFAGDLLAVMSQVTLDDPPLPSRRRSGVDPRLDAICLRALAKKPADRFPTMQLFAEALAGCGGGSAQARRSAHQVIGPATLTLRVVGTPFAYRPRANQTIISVGRQRRKAGEPDDTGNDMVLRVPGSTDLSARISRRHFEIHVDGGQFFVTDRSKVGTLLNDTPLSRNVATPLASGDRLVVAGVLELEVALHLTPTVQIAAPQVQLPGASGAILEATFGDMVTME